jgi:hypothetical protein
LEIAIVISIIGLISGFFINKTIMTGKIMRKQTTKNNISAVSIALAAFVANNNRLPRPALDGNGHESAESEMKYIGKVPYYTLGIPMKNAADGNGKQLIYIVENQLTRNHDSIYDKSFLDSCFCDEILDRKITVDAVAPGRNTIAFVIDTEDNPPVVSADTKKVSVTASKNTCWVLRDILLMQYLKNSPCAKEDNSRHTTNIAPDFVEDQIEDAFDSF